MVPVLSTHKIFIAAASSMADRRVTSTPFLESSTDPKAVDRAYVAGNATGTEATSRRRKKGMSSESGTPWKKEYANIKTINARSNTTRYLTMVNTVFSRLEGVFVARIISAVF